MTDTEPIDLDAIEQILGNARESTSRITSLMAAYRLVDYDVPALIAEVRRLREVEASKGQDVNWQYGVRRKGSHVVGYEFTREGAISLCAEMNDGREPVRRSREGEWEAFA